MDIFLINLEQSKERLQAQKNQFKKQHLDFIRMPAVSITDIDDDYYQKVAFSWQRPLKKAEIACILSHKKLWQWSVDNNKACVILEDDVLLVNNFKEIINEIEQFSPTIDYINLEAHSRRKKIISNNPIITLCQAQFSLYNLFLDKSGTGGYIIYPSGAKKLLQFLDERPLGPADEFIFSCPYLNKYQIEPAALIQSDQSACYGVTNHLIYHSVIGQTPKSPLNELGFLSALKFKFRRLLGQMKTGLNLLTQKSKGTQKVISVNPDFFDTNHISNINQKS